MPPSSTSQQVEEGPAAAPATTADTSATPTPSAGGASGGVMNYGHDEAVMQAIMNASASNVREGELQYSRLAMLQPQSPEITREEIGFKMGMIVNNLTRDVYSREIYPPWMIARGMAESDLKKMQIAMFVPVLKLPSEFIEWRDRKTEGDGWKFKSLDEFDPHVVANTWKPTGVWKPSPDGKGRRSPPVTENINFFGLMLDPADYSPLSSFLVCTFAKTSSHAGKRLTSACESHRLCRNSRYRQLPYWGISYYLYSKKEQGEGSDTWFEYNVAVGPKMDKYDPEGVVDAECYQTAAALSDTRPAPGSTDPKFTMGRMRQETVINAAAMDGTNEEKVPGGPSSPMGEPINPPSVDPF